MVQPAEARRGGDLAGVRPLSRVPRRLQAEISGTDSRRPPGVGRAGDSDGNDFVEHWDGFTLNSGAAEDEPVHDASGNLTYDGNYNFTYDAWNRLVRVKRAYRDSGGALQVASTVSTLTYDPLGRRIIKDVANSGDWDATYHYFYDGQSMIETRNGSDQVLTQHTWGVGYIDELVQIAHNDDPADGGEDVCETAYYALTSANYNVIGLVDAGGLVERYEYTPYGQRTVFISSGSNDPLVSAPILESQRWQVSSVDQPYGLCDIGHQGLMHDKEFGLIYNRARYLHPRLGRFTARDPGEYGDGLNLYRYVNSTPVNAVDPSGAVAVLFGGGLRLMETKSGPITTGPTFVPPAFFLLAALKKTVDGEPTAVFEGTEIGLNKAREWLKGLPERQKCERVVIAGYSSGTSVGLALAHEFRDGKIDWKTEGNPVHKLIMYDLNWGAVGHPDYAQVLKGDFSRPGKDVAVHHIVSNGGVDVLMWRKVTHYHYNDIGVADRSFSIWVYGPVKHRISIRTSMIGEEVGRNRPNAKQLLKFGLHLANSTGSVTSRYIPELAWAEPTAFKNSVDHFELGWKMNPFELWWLLDKPEVLWARPRVK